MCYEVSESAENMRFREVWGLLPAQDSHRKHVAASGVIGPGAVGDEGGTGSGEAGGLSDGSCHSAGASCHTTLSQKRSIQTLLEPVLVTRRWVQVVPP